MSTMMPETTTDERTNRYVRATISEEQWDAEAVRDALAEWLARDDTDDVKVSATGSNLHDWIHADDVDTYEISESGWTVYAKDADGDTLAAVDPSKELVFHRATESGEPVEANPFSEDN